MSLCYDVGIRPREDTLDYNPPANVQELSGRRLDISGRWCSEGCASRLRYFMANMGSVLEVFDV